MSLDLRVCALKKRRKAGGGGCLEVCLSLPTERFTSVFISFIYLFMPGAKDQQQSLKSKKDRQPVPLESIMWEGSYLLSHTSGTALLEGLQGGRPGLCGSLKVKY